MLLTRPPLGGKSKSEIVQALKLHWATSYDLHVLGMPPAFILSQDQTLKNIFHFLCLLFLATQNTFDVLLSFQRSFSLCFTKVFTLLFDKCVINITYPKSYVNNFFYFFSKSCF